MAREIDTAMEETDKAFIRRTEGQSIDPQNLAIVRPSKEQEQDIFSMPVARYGVETPLQNPDTGEFYFMLGVHGLCEAPLA